MAKFLCIDCCKRIEEKNQYDVGFIDCKTYEGCPIQGDSIKFYIGDYVVCKDKADDETLKYLIFYETMR